MKTSLFFLFLSFPFICYTSELSISYRSYHHLITPKSTFQLQNKDSFFVDFGKNISSTKTSHIQVFFPDDLTTSPPFPMIPHTTPEIDFLSEKYGEGKIDALLYGEGGRCSGYGHETIKIFVYEWRGYIGDIECTNIQDARTNTVIMVSYDFVSTREGNTTLRIFPLHPNQIYLDESESYMLSFLYDNNSDYKERDPNARKFGSMPGMISAVLRQPLRLLGSSMDIYDISMQVNGKDIVVVNNPAFSIPVERKLLFTQFGPDVRVDLWDGVSEMEIENFATLLPYYEVDIPVQKGQNTLTLQYKTLKPTNMYSRSLPADIKVVDLMQK